MVGWIPFEIAAAAAAELRQDTKNIENTSIWRSCIEIFFVFLLFSFFLFIFELH